MIKYFLQGLSLGLAYVAPIGMQNLYVINTAATQKKLRAYQVALITIFFDISLGLSCFFGIGLIVEKLPVLKGVILAAGSLAVIYIGIGLLKSKPSLSEDLDVSQPILKVITSCFAVTWLNPQALIDGSLLLGGFRASLPQDASTLFILGVALASFTWFMSLATIISIFKNKISINVLRYINIICGSIIILYGLKLGLSFINFIR